MSRISNDDIYDIVAVNFNEDSDEEVTLDYSRTYSKILNPGNTPRKFFSLDTDIDMDLINESTKPIAPKVISS